MMPLLFALALVLADHPWPDRHADAPFEVLDLAHLTPEQARRLGDRPPLFLVELAGLPGDPDDYGGALVFDCIAPTGSTLFAGVWLWAGHWTRPRSLT